MEINNTKKRQLYSLSFLGRSRTAVVSCIEVALMRRGNANYNSVLAKLRSQHNCDIDESIDKLEYLKDALKQVYKQEYHLVLEDITWELEALDTPEIDNFKAEFCKFMGDT